MSSIPYNTENGNEIFDSATKFLKEFQVGKLLFKCNAGKRRKQSRRKATEVMLELIQTAQHAGLSAKYVLFDSWFSSPKAVVALKQKHGLETIAMVKKSSKIKYGYQDGRFNIKEIYSKNRKRRGRSKYLL